MRSRIVKVGNSRAVIIPAGIADDKRLEVGDAIDIEPTYSGVVINKPPRRVAVLEVAKRALASHDALFKDLAKR